MSRSCFLAVAFLAITGASQAGEAAAPVKPLEVRKVYGDGKHNAFTALVRWKGDLWLAFRNAAGHNSGTGSVLLLRSRDGRSWAEVKRLEIAPNNGDPQLLATPTRLLLYEMAVQGSGSQQTDKPYTQAYVTHTDDGTTWSTPAKVYEEQFIFWKPVVHAGRFWAVAHRKDDRKGGLTREARLIESADGVKWNAVATIRKGNWESETTLWMKGDTAVAFMKAKKKPYATILEAKAPYQEWKSRKANVEMFSGHSCHTFKGITYLLSRSVTTVAGKEQMGTTIYTVEADGSLKPYCILPAGGDCSYAEAVEDGDNMLVSYYSGHETNKPMEKTNIYLAVVPLKK